MSRPITYALQFVLLAIILSSSAPDLAAQTLDARVYIIIVPGDSAKEWIELDTLQIKSLIRRVAMIDDSTSPGGGLTLAQLIDSLDVVFTTTSGRLLHYSNVQPGNDGDLFVTAAGAAAWTATPTLADRVGQYFYWTSIAHNNPADTTGGKNLAYISSLSKLWPVPHGTVWSALTADFYMRSDTHNRYSATMTTVGGGATSIVAGDALVMREFPAIAAADKQVRLYRIPSGYRADGWASGTAVYGEHIGTWTIPAALFSGTSSTTNLECTLTLKVK